MIARGAIGNPWIFKQITDYLEKGTYEEVSPKEKVETCLEHARRLIAYYKDEIKAMKEMRSLACFYIKGFKNAAKVRGTIHTLLSYDKLEEILLECLKNEEDK
jgi:tRNA-dihydrouridine synthase B